MNGFSLFFVAMRSEVGKRIDRWPIESRQERLCPDIMGGTEHHSQSHRKSRAARAGTRMKRNVSINLCSPVPRSVRHRRHTVCPLTLCRFVAVKVVDAIRNETINLRSHVRCKCMELSLQATFFIFVRSWLPAKVVLSGSILWEDIE